MMKKLLLGSLLVSSAALAAGPEASVASSAAISSNEVGTGRYFYLAQNYQELAAVPAFTMSAPAGLVPGFRSSICRYWRITHSRKRRKRY